MEWDAELDSRCRVTIQRLLAIETEEGRRPMWRELLELIAPHLDEFAKNSRILWNAHLRDRHHVTSLVTRVTESMRRRQYANLEQFWSRYTGPTDDRGHEVEVVDETDDVPTMSEDSEDLFVGVISADGDDSEASVHDGTPFRGWVLKLTMFRALDHVRHVYRQMRRDRELTRDLEHVPKKSTTLPSRAAAEEQFEAFYDMYKQALAELDSLDRRVLTLYGQGRKRNEIAREVRRNVNTVSNIRARAIKKLRRRTEKRRDEADVS